MRMPESAPPKVSRCLSSALARAVKGLTALQAMAAVGSAFPRVCSRQSLKVREGVVQGALHGHLMSYYVARIAE